MTRLLKVLAIVNITVLFCWALVACIPGDAATESAPAPSAEVAIMKAFAALAEEDSVKAKIVLAGMLAKANWHVPGPTAERIHLSCEPCPTGGPTVGYMVRYIADFIVPQPEFDLWVEMDLCQGYSSQWRAVGVDGSLSGYTAPLARGVLMEDIPLGRLCE